MVKESFLFLDYVYILSLLKAIAIFILNDSEKMNGTKYIYSNQSSKSTFSATSFIQYLQLFYVPCLALLGIIGNILCAIVFSTKSLR